MTEVRIAKYIADAGICSRREAERLIQQGKVKLNGVVLETPAVKVTEKDEVQIDGKKIQSKSNCRLWIFNKPKGVITSNRDEKGRRTVFDILPKTLPRVVTIGRLDYNTEGLLLLTTSGELSRRYELPATALKRVYRCRVHGRLTKAIISKLDKGIVSRGIKYGKIIVKIESHSGSNSWVEVTLTEGKNREIRNAFEHFGLVVNRLIRVQYGPYELKDLKVGDVKETEIRI
jgi:23S rRNA pseudouridine2605 synthase